MTASQNFQGLLSTRNLRGHPLEVEMTHQLFSFLRIFEASTSDDYRLNRIFDIGGDDQRSQWGLTRSLGVNH